MAGIAEGSLEPPPSPTKGVCFSARMSVVAKQLAGDSPGPVYLPDDRKLSKRPNTGSAPFTSPGRQWHIEDVPGPGAVLDDPEFGRRLVSTQRSLSSMKFTTAGRLPPTRRTDGPGPGTAEPRSSTDGPRYSIVGKPPNEPDPTPKPGPGQYTLPGPDTRSVKFGGSDCNRDLTTREARDRPGPGQYRPEASDEKLSETHAVPFTEAQQRPPVLNAAQRDLPGPGAYAIPSTVADSYPESGIKKVHAAYFGPAPRPSSPEVLPGPGQYDTANDSNRPLSRHHSVTGIKFTSGQLRTTLKSETENAELQDTREASKKLSTTQPVPGMKFTSATRGLRPQTASPGPSAYSLASIQQGVKATRRGTLRGVKWGARHESRLHRDRSQPGPQSLPSSLGPQTLSRQRSAGSFSFGSGPKLYTDKLVKDGPGPQAYSPDKPRKVAVTGVKFGTGPQRYLDTIKAQTVPKYRALPSTMGPQIDSTKRSVHGCSFGGR